MMSEEELQRLKEIKAAKRDGLISLPNVTGVGIGRKVVGGKYTDQMAIRVYVSKKLPKERLKGDERIPGEVEDVPTDVLQIGEPRLLTHTTHARPARGGDSIGDCILIHEGWYTAGTLGGLFIDNTDGADVILSNNHVIAGFDFDDVDTAHAGDDVVQPGTLDWGSCTTDVIATLKRWVEYREIPQWNRVDGAIAEVINAGDVLNDIHVIGQPSGHRALTVADEGVTIVQKSGRTTQYTQGRVFDVSYDTSPMTTIRGRRIQFEDQILIQPIGGVPVSDHGDSGSLVLDMERQVVGLLFAGTDDGYAIANHIDEVFNELDIRLPGLPGVVGPIAPICLLELPHCLRELPWIPEICRSLITPICWAEAVCMKLPPACLSEMACLTLTAGCMKLYWPLPPDRTGRYAFIDLDTIPLEMQRRVESMLEEIRKYLEG
jgi:hypothetical protein